MSRIGDSTGVSGEQGQGLADKVTEVSQNLRDLGSQARDTAQQKYEELRNSAGDYYEQGRHKAHEWEHTLEEYVHEKPLQAVLIAAGVGVVLGMLWKRS